MHPLSLWSVARRSLRYFARSHAAVALGIAAATAVIVGALVVGDSVRGSLKKLVVDRLGTVDSLLHSRTFFDPALLDGPNRSLEDGEQSKVVGAMLFRSTTAEFREETGVTRASQVQLLGVPSSFWQTQLDQSPDIGPDEVAVNRALATELGVEVGDEISISLTDPSGVPGDNPLGKRDDRSITLPRQRIAVLLSDESIGGLSFQAGQSVPKNIFASLETLQDVLECGEKLNAALVLSDADDTSGSVLCNQLNESLRPKLEDYGLKLELHQRVFPDPEIERDMAATSLETVYDYFQLSSNDLVIDDQTSASVVAALEPLNPMRVVTYLANSVAKVEPNNADLDYGSGVAKFGRPPSAEKRNSRGAQMMIMAFAWDMPDEDSLAQSERAFLSREVPYSIVVGIDETELLSTSQYLQIELAELRYPYCFINQWLAEQLDAKPGDWFRATYFEPETVDGKEVERWTNFQIAGIVPLTEPVTPYQRSRPAVYASPPSRFNDPHLTPSVPGVTDQDSISKWDLPFKLERVIDDVDDEYWNNHRLTPKVFMPHRFAASKLTFGSRFGSTTSVHISSAAMAEKSVDEQQLREMIEQALMPTRPLRGLAFMPIREQQMQSASGSTPFDLLFLSLSFFVIVAALILVFLLFKLGIQQRVSELGILQAQGFTAERIRGLLLRELLLVGLIGTVLGIGVGILYARLMIAGLESWWIGAISSRFLNIFVSPQSLIIGGVAGLFSSLGAIFIGLRGLAKMNPLSLLRGRTEDNEVRSTKDSKMMLAIAGFVAVAAVGVLVAGIGQTGMARAGSFFGSGMLFLVAALLAVWRLMSSSDVDHRAQGKGLLGLAWSTICRNPLRSALCLGLLSVAAFLIASMGVFQISPSEKGYGGFDLLATSSQPIFRNIGSTSVRDEMLGDQAEALRRTSIVSFRARPGEDASCNNLFQVSQPTILGLPTTLREQHQFAPEAVEFGWAGAENSENPWMALESKGVGTEDDPIPTILDQNTAAWSLKQGASIGGLVKLELQDRTLFFRTVGLLSNSVLQGKLIIGQENFERAFPEISGYSFFMIRSGKETDPKQVTELLESGWSAEGLDVTSSSETLARFLGVQNTYISAFQSLGALGLLLGTLGLIAVQIRSVIERRRELALMRALGFPPSRIAALLTAETAILLGGGLLSGILCAAIALVPYMIETQPGISALSPIVGLSAVLVVGFLASWLAVRVAAKQPVVEALRSD